MRFDSATNFLAECEPLLLPDESFYNLKLGLINTIKQNKIETTAPLYFGIYEKDQLIGCALRSHQERPLAISRMTPPAVNALADFLLTEDLDLNGIIGEIQSAINFKNHWCRTANKKSKVNIHLGIYECNNVILPNVNGSMVNGTLKEYETIFQFIKSFTHDCFPHQTHTNESIEKVCKRHVENQNIFLLKNEDDQFVAMAANTRNSQNGGTVSLVYTDSSYRGKGYGSLITALVTNKILAQKTFSNLFTDLTNPTSNSIYQKIGYKFIGENIHFDFYDEIIQDEIAK